MKNARLYSIAMNGIVTVTDVTVDMEAREIYGYVDNDAFQNTLHVDGEAYKVVGNKF